MTLTRTSLRSHQVIESDHATTGLGTGLMFDIQGGFTWPRNSAAGMCRRRLRARHASRPSAPRPNLQGTSGETPPGLGHTRCRRSRCSWLGCLAGPPASQRQPAGRPAGEQHLPRRSSLDTIGGGHAGRVLVSLGRGSGRAFRRRGGDGSFRVPNTDRKLLLCSVFLNS